MLTLSTSAFRAKADIPNSLVMSANDPKRTFHPVLLICRASYLISGSPASTAVSGVESCASQARKSL